VDVDAPSDYEALRELAIVSCLLVPLGSDGVYARSAAFEAVVLGIEHQVDRLGSVHEPFSVSFPPVVPMEIAERASVPDSFPDLLGVVRPFMDDVSSGAGAPSHDNASRPRASLALVSSACHPLYPLFAGVLPEAGRYANVLGHCFRYEPSPDPARMLSFRQKELVFLGEADAVEAQYRAWIEQAQRLLHGLGLDVRTAVGHDPFFGRAGRLLADMQESKGLKTELVVRLHEEAGSTAIASCNLHEDHFGRLFGIETALGSTAHSVCVGFGLERIALALVHRHGPSPQQWPAPLRERLGL